MAPLWVIPRHTRTRARPTRDDVEELAEELVAADDGDPVVEGQVVW